MAALRSQFRVGRGERGAALLQPARQLQRHEPPPEPGAGPRARSGPVALDERLFCRSRELKPGNAQDGVVVFGYLGTFTHLNDFRLFVWWGRCALLYARFRDRVTVWKLPWDRVHKRHT